MLEHGEGDDCTTCSWLVEHGACVVDTYKVDGENNGVSLRCMAHLIRVNVEIVKFVSRIF